MRKHAILPWARCAALLLLCALTVVSCVETDNPSGSSDDGKTGPARNYKTIMLASDIHVMASELLESKGEAYNKYQGNDPKLLEYSPEVLNSLVDEALKQKPDLVIIPGDLTKDGELVSHLLVASTLRQLRTAGIPVVVVPGNHDIDNPEGCYYNGAQTRYAERTSKEQFADIYRDFGFAQAFARDDASLSYACEPLNGLVLLCIDTNMYEDNQFKERGADRDFCMIGGRIREKTMTWMLDQADKARQQGKQVAVVEHHGIVEHFDGQALIQSDYVLKDHEEVAKQMMQHGIHLVFSGHTHLQDIAQYRTMLNGVKDSLVDVATGSTICYPNPYRTITVNNDYTQWQIGTQYVKSIPSVFDVQKMCYNLLYDNIYSGLGGYVNIYWSTIDSYRSKLALFGLPEGFLPPTPEATAKLLTDNLGTELSQIFLIFNQGNEGKNPLSALLGAQVKSKAEAVVSQRLKDLGKSDSETTVIMNVLLAAYDYYVGKGLNSLLTDTNQMQNADLSSVTDDLNVVLNIGR